MSLCISETGIEEYKYTLKYLKILKYIKSMR